MKQLGNEIKERTTIELLNRIRKEKKKKKKDKLNEKLFIVMYNI